MTIVLTTTADMNAAAQTWRATGKRIGLVPTMGNLHEGHLTLIRLAKKHADVIVVSIFVNPTQFGPNEDYAAYPRTFAADRARCIAEGVDIIFHPTAAEMYPPDTSIRVTETALSQTLCGASRPGHFDGVCTIVSKLFQIIQPHIAIFGEKDAQQLRIIRRLVRDQNYPIQIIPAPTAREPDGLACSSRNNNLTPAQRPQATSLHRALTRAEQLFAAGERHPPRLIAAMRETITATAPDAKIDYISIVDDETLQPITGPITRPALAALAVWVGTPRLIDNTLLNPLPPPPPRIENVVLIGLGAIGTLYAAQCTTRNPAHFRVLADAPRIAAYQKDPPTLNGHPLHLTYITPENPGPPADLILVAVKAPALPAILPAIAAVCAPHTQILPLLNGLHAQDTLARHFGPHHVLHGLVHCSSAMRTRHAVTQNGPAKIIFGEATNTPPYTPRVQAISHYFTRHHITHEIPPDMRHAQWRKLILNVGINQAQGIYRATTGQLQQNPQAMQYARTLMDEAAAIAAALGIPDALQIPDWAENIIRAAAPDTKTSLLQDLQANRETEIDIFAGELIRLGHHLGIPTPANQHAHTTLTQPK